jgi:hypothetical protein
MNPSLKLVLSTILITLFILGSVSPVATQQPPAYLFEIVSAPIETFVSSTFEVDIVIEPLGTEYEDMLSEFRFVVKVDPQYMKIVDAKRSNILGGDWTLIDEQKNDVMYLLSGREGVSGTGPIWDRMVWATLTIHCEGRGISEIFFDSELTFAANRVENGELTFIDASVNQIIEPAAVGGITIPTHINKLEILAPYLVLAGLIVTISAVMIKKRK